MARGISKSLLYSAYGVNALLMYSLSVTNMASIYILSSLGGNYVTGSYTISFFAIGNALTIPLYLTLRTVFGLKRAIFFCIWTFVVVSFLMTFSPTYPIFLFCRFLQGCTSGPLLILVPSIISNLATEQDRNLYIRNVTIVYIAAPAIGSTLGGFLAYECAWHWIGYIDTVLGVVLGLAFYFNGRGYTFEKTEKRIDPLGYSFYAVALLSISVFIIMGQELDWFRSYLLSALFPIGLIALIYFIIHLTKSERPVFNVGLLRKPQMIFALIQIATLFSGYFAMVYLLAIWLNQFVSYTPNWIGAILLIMVFAAVSVMLILNRYKGRIAFLSLIVAIILVGISNYQTMNFFVNVNFGRIAFSRVVAGMGFALFLPPLFYLVLEAGRAEEEFEALTLFQVTRAIACGSGLSIYATIWQRREVFYYDRLGGQLTKLSHRTAQFFEKLKMFYIEGPRSNQELEKALQMQSQSLALNDTFYLMYWITIGLFILAIAFYFYKRHKRPLQV